jgi:crotonobetainyl-CoA:carnitine CoA-transferase CaiB-like acyl-CoA transferase
MPETSVLPLARFSVLDLTRARAGPTCVRQLVDWGARAVKIEMPGGRSGDGMGGNRHGFDLQNLHRNKRAMTLNLPDPDGVAIFKQVARDADVVVENYRPDVKRRLGIDYEDLRAINPRLVYGSISGFGQSGPYRDRPGVDQIAQGMGGLMSITGIPTGVFETKDGHINIAAAGDEIYERFCRAIERPDLRTDARFATSRARSTNREALMDVLRPVTRQKTSADWVKILNDAGVPCGPIYRVDESFADPQVRHLKMAQPVRSPALGELTILGHPVSHGADRLPIRTAAPALGQDNEEILGSLGYGQDQIADLAKRGVI